MIYTKNIWIISKKAWKPFFENGMLNYVYISKEQRSNIIY